MKFISILITLFALNTSLAEVGSGDSGNLFGDVFDTTLETTKANDYMCGSLVVQVSDGWKIKEVELKQGSIQNQFQFKEAGSGNKLFLPEGLGGEFLHVRQPTGYFAELYLFNHPIDFTLVLAQDGLFNEVRYRVQKSVCNSLKVGEVKVTLLEGNRLDYMLVNSEQDDTTWSVHWFSSRFFTPAYLVIPAPASGPTAGEE